MLSPQELRRQIAALVVIRDKRREELIQSLIAVDSIDHRIDVLLGRLASAGR